jgi:hypothetical protein
MGLGDPRLPKSSFTAAQMRQTEAAARARVECGGSSSATEPRCIRDKPSALEDHFGDEISETETEKVSGKLIPLIAVRLSYVALNRTGCLLGHCE